jgi:ABC-type transport system substrate-binding protein
VRTTPAGETPIYGGKLVISTGASPRSLIPEPNYIRNFYSQMAHDTLLKLDEKGALQPNLVTEWKLGPGNKSLTLTIRKNVRFHDGTPLNAEAVKWNILNKQAAKLGDYEGVTSVDVVDDVTVRLNIDSYRNTLLPSLWFIAGLMQSPTAYQKDGKTNAQFHPVGTGPFKFVSYSVSQQIKYVRNDDYWQNGLPYVDAVDINIIADATTRELDFRNSGAHASETLPAKNVAALQQDGWKVLVAPPEVYNTFAGDSANADSPFSNIKVRQAIEYAIDRPTVAKQLGYGYMQPLTQTAFTGSPAFNASIVERKYDPAKAKQLLAEAGYPNGFKTKLLTIFSVADTLTAAQGYLKEVGIDGEIDLADSGRYYSLTQQTGWKNELVYRARRQVPDWLSDINKEFSTAGIELKSMTRPPGMQDLLVKALSATDDATKNALSKDFVKMVYDDSTVIPTWGANYTIPIQKNVHNIEYYEPWGPNKLWGPATVWISK